MDIKFYDLSFSVIKSRDAKEIVNHDHENNEDEYFIYNDYFVPNVFLGGKIDDVLLKLRKLTFQINNFNFFLLRK